MSITVNVSGLRASVEGAQLVAATKIDLIRHGLVCGRPWWIAGPAVSRWTAWPPAPDGLRAFSAAELLSIRRTAVLLSGYLREPRPGGAITTTGRFRGLERTQADEARARLDAAVAGQVAWSVLGVPALHHIGWMGPNLGIGAAGRRAYAYAGRLSGPRARWTVLRTTSAPVLAAVGARDAGAGVTVRVHPGDEHTALRADVDRPAAVESDVPSGVDPDRLEEQRYAPFARAVAAGIRARAATVQGPAGEEARVRLFPLGVTGHIGVTAEVAEAIDAALAARDAGAARTEFVRRVQALRRAQAQAAPPSVQPAPSPRSRRPPRGALAWTADIDGLRHDASVGADGIALLLASSVVRAQAQDG